MPKKLLGLREFAAHRGVHHSTIQAAVRAGRVTPTMVKGKPKFDPVKHGRALDQFTDPAKQNRKGKSPKPEAGKADPPEETPTADSSAKTYSQSRAVREAYNARLARIEYEVKTGKLISADKVKAEAYRTARTVRDALLNIPDRISAQVAALADVQTAQIHDLISTEIRLAMEELVNAQKRKSE